MLLFWGGILPLCKGYSQHIQSFTNMCMYIYIYIYIHSLTEIFFTYMWLHMWLHISISYQPGVISQFGSWGATATQGTTSIFGHQTGYYFALSIMSCISLSLISHNDLALITLHLILVEKILYICIYIYIYIYMHTQIHRHI